MSKGQSILSRREEIPNVSGQSKSFDEEEEDVDDDECDSGFLECLGCFE
jgi:hypothetical protein